MKRKFRLTRERDINRVRRDGKSFAHPFVVLITCPNASTISRVAIITSRTLGNAVERNRIRRQIRAIAQKSMSKILAGWDITIIAKAAIKGSSYERISQALLGLLVKAGLTTLDDNR